VDITLKNISKQFNREFIFKDINYQFESGKSYGIVGANGSGKSTLLQVVSGYLRPSKGKLTYGDGTVEVDDIFNDIIYISPYLELIEEFTLIELLDFHFKFKPQVFSNNEFIKKTYLEDARNKYVKHFSSGMKQRLKLALGLFSEADIVFFDEPTTNLDTTGIDWYLKEITTLRENNNRTILIASNQKYEYDFCDHALPIENYK